MKFFLILRLLFEIHKIIDFVYLLGAIFHEGDELLESAFDQALKDLENEQNNFFNLIAVKKTNVELESFKTASVGMFHFL